MHVQKKGNAFYLQTSEWSVERQRSVTKSTYLGSGIDNALISLQTRVPEYHYLDIRDKLLKTTIKKTSDIFNDLQKQLTAIENNLSELEVNSDKKTKSVINKIRKLHSELLSTHDFNYTPPIDDNQTILEI